jgi:hypothetical protein
MSQLVSMYVPLSVSERWRSVGERRVAAVLVLAAAAVAAAAAAERFPNDKEETQRGKETERARIAQLAA